MAIFNLQRAWRIGDNARLVADIYLTVTIKPPSSYHCFSAASSLNPLKKYFFLVATSTKELDVVTTIVTTGKVRTHALLAWMLVVDQQD